MTDLYRKNAKYWVIRSQDTKAVMLGYV